MELNNTKLVYVACAFQQDDPKIRKERIESVACFCADQMRKGIVVFCPLVHNYGILKYGLPIGWDYWEKFNKVLLARCDKLFVLKLKGWEKSIGLQAEIATARELKIPIEYHEFHPPKNFYESLST